MSDGDDERLFHEANASAGEIVFNTAETFDDLLRFNTAYIQGRIGGTSYMCGPLSKETSHAMIERLLAIHKMGILTHSSQPGLWQTTYRADTGTFHEIRQKPYLRVVMHRDRFARVIARIDASFIHFRAHTMTNEPCGTNACEVVTDQRSAATLKGLAAAAFVPQSRIWRSRSGEMRTFFPILDIDEFVEADFWVAQWSFDTETFMDTLIVAMDTQ
jgi:hypothetical protein